VITVLIADDQPLQRLGFRALLDSNDDTTVIGEARNGAEAVRQAAALHPDVVLMDIRMPGTDGIQATKEIIAAGARSRVLVLTTFDIDEYVYDALRAGASGFLLKDARPDELLAGIRTVATGEAVLAATTTRRLLQTFTNRAPRVDASPRLATLTPRERDVLLGIATGLTNAEIAERLVVSESTVKTHVGRVLAKINARDRVHAVIIAYDAGLVPRQPGNPHLTEERRQA
jgi:DNA-binding NarL/FixJ family response regulator